MLSRLSEECWNFYTHLRAERNTRAAQYLCVAASLIAGCVAHTNIKAAGPLKPWPATIVVVIDSQFTTAESNRIVLGVDMWIRSVGEQNIHVVTATADGGTLATIPEGWIYIKRSADLVDCAGTNGGKVGCWHPDERLIDLVPDHVSQDEEIILAAHEFGHALGLVHRPAPSIMAPQINNASSGPTAEDIAAYCQLRGCQ